MLLLKKKMTTKTDSAVNYYYDVWQLVVSENKKETDPFFALLF